MPGMSSGKLGSQGRGMQPSEGFGPPTKYLVTFQNVKTGKISRRTLTKKQFDDFRSTTMRVIAWSGV